MASDFATYTTNPSQTVPSSSTSMVDEFTNNPYFLPVTKSPGIILASQPLIGTENYISLDRSAFLALSARNKVSFVNGSIPILDLSSPLYNSRCRCNTMVLSWLNNSLNKEIGASVMYINIVRDLWIDIQDGFPQGNSPKLYEL